MIFWILLVIPLAFAAAKLVIWLEADDVTYLDARDEERAVTRELVLVRDPATQARDRWSWDFDREVDAA